MRIKKFLTVPPILFFSLLFGFFLWEIYVVYNNPGYNVLWHGWWITARELEGDVFYFRKKFNLSDGIKNAWLLVSASDEFEVYLNGKKVDQMELDSWFPIGIYDVTTRVNFGINVLAIRVQKRNFKGPVKAAIDLGYEDTYGNKHYVFSDETWRLSNKAERNSLFGPSWYEMNFDDSSWMGARVLGKPEGFWLNVDPRVYTTAPNGRWFWAGNRREISCQAEINIPKKPWTAWIRLASRGAFRFVINRNRVDVQEAAIGTENEVIPIVGTMPEGILRIYEIGSFLKLGNNTILIPAYAEGQNRGLYIDGIIEADGWSKKIDETDFKCFYSAKTFLPTYRGDPGWVHIEKKEIQQGVFMPLWLIILMYFKLIFIIFISSVVFIGLTFAVKFITRLPIYSLSRAYIIPSLFLIFVYILRYDTRFYWSFPFQTKFVILSLFLLFLFWLLSPLIDRVKIRSLPRYVPAVTLILIVLVGAFLRFKVITQESLHIDEAYLMVKNQGILDYGCPCLKLAPELPLWYVSTSELLSYIQALSFIILGKSEFSLRLPGVLFGILTIPLLYCFGKMIGGERVGLLASAVFSLLPSAIDMTSFARYPSQVCFFSLLTSFLGFVYLKTDKNRYLYLCYLSLLLTYFTWQGSAFMVLTLLVMRIIMGKKDRIFKDIKAFLFIVAPVISIHLTVRLLLIIFQGDFFFGPSVSEVVPALMFLHPLYDPFYYITNFFFIPGHQFLSILFFAGFPLALIRSKTYRDLLFLYVNPILIPFLMSNLLQISVYRYVYYLLPYLILCACIVLFVFLDYLGHNKNYYRFLNSINSIFASLVLIVISCGIWVNLSNFPSITEQLKNNPNLRYLPETRAAADFIKTNIQPGDIVVTLEANLFDYYYLDKADYFFISKLASIPVAVFPRGSNVLAVEIRDGTPAVLSLNELERIIGSGNRRVWFVAVPQYIDHLDNDSIKFLTKNKRVLFERYLTEVSLIGGE